MCLFHRQLSTNRGINCCRLGLYIRTYSCHVISKGLQSILCHYDYLMVYHIFKYFILFHSVSVFFIQRLLLLSFHRSACFWYSHSNVCILKSRLSIGLLVLIYFPSLTHTSYNLLQSLYIKYYDLSADSYKKLPAITTP